MTIADCIITELPRIQDPRGDLTYSKSGEQAPFDVRRVYQLYDVPRGPERGGHAHLQLHQLMTDQSWASTRLNG